MRRLSEGDPAVLESLPDGPLKDVLSRLDPECFVCVLGRTARSL